MYQDVNDLLVFSAGETKDTNPKDAIAGKKVPLHLLPPAGVIYGAAAMRNGADKYGPFNWRDKHVRATVYISAMLRHILAYLDGEDCAADSGLPHLGHAIACAAILADATEGGFLVDDRPQKGPAAKTLEKFERKE